MMTDEELQEAINDLSESINNLPKADKSLSKEEKRRRQLLLLKKETLEKIKEAREKNQSDDESYNAMVYGLLTSWWGKHLYLMSLIKTRLRWGVF